MLGLGARGSVGLGVGQSLFRGPTSPLLTGLVAYWKLDEAAAGNRADAHGGYTLTQTGTVDPTTGKIGNGAGLFSASNYLRNSSNGLDIGLSDRSVSFWVKHASFGTHSYLSSGAGGTAKPGFWVLALTATNARLSFNDTGTRIIVDFAHGMSTGTWYHWIAEFDRDGNMLAYINNVPKTAVSIAAKSTSDINDMGQFAVGIHNELNFPLDGYLDEVGVWNRLLTSDERALLYGAGSGLTYPFA